MYSNKTQPPPSNPSLTGTSNGLPAKPAGPNVLRRHSRSRSNNSINSVSTALVVSAAPGFPPPKKSTGRRPSPIQTDPSAPIPPRPNTAPFRPESQDPAQEPRQQGANRTQITSPGSKRRSSIAEGLVERFAKSPPANPAGNEREHRRRTSFARRLSFGGSGPSASFNGVSKAQSPSNRSPSGRRAGSEVRRRTSPDPSPTKRRSFHSPPPPAGKSRSSAANLPPISTLPSLPKLSFDALSASTGTPSPPATLGTPLTVESTQQADYFNSKSAKSSRSPQKLRRETPNRTRPGVAKSSEDLKSSKPSQKEFTEPFPPSDPYIATSIYAPNYPKPKQRTASRSSNRERSNSEGSLLGPNASGGSGGTPTRRRDKRERDKKAMLSRALQKANTAVLLDNGQNFVGAVDAYSEACQLLQHVMAQSSGEDDRRKLDAIRQTYTNRINELYELDPSLRNPSSERPLPARPESDVEPATALSKEPPSSDDDEPAVIQTATTTRLVNDRRIDTSPSRNPPPRPPPPASGPAGDQTLSSAFNAVESAISQDPQTSLLFQRPFEFNRDQSQGRGLLDPPIDENYMPAPLSPRHPPPSPRTVLPQQQSDLLQPPQHPPNGHSRNGSGEESGSWLDTIDESSSSSCRSSVHSASSRGNAQRKIKDTQAEYDAAMDVAVEAAYDQGLAAYDDQGQMLSSGDAVGDAVRTALRNVELAKEKVREAEREEAIQAARLTEQERLLQNGRDLQMPVVRGANFSPTSPYDDLDAEEEERLLDEMTREYMLDDFDFGLQNKSALPRQSDSSEFSGSVWSNSRSSNRTTGTTAATAMSSLGAVVEATKDFERPAISTSKSMTALPTVAEKNAAAQTANGMQRPSISRPSTSSGSAPKQPPPAPSVSTMPQQPSSQTGVRSRRMSGQNAKQLKIETSVPNKMTVTQKKQELAPLSSESTPPSVPPKSPAMFGDSKPAPQPAKALQEPLPPFANSPAETTVTVSPATPGISKITSSDMPPPSPGQGMLGAGKGTRLELRKNKSSLSLKNRQVSVSSPDHSDSNSVGVSTPMSTTFSNYSIKSKATTATLVQSSAASQTTGTTLTQVPSLGQGLEVNGLPSGGMHLFESDIHSPSQPGSPNPLAFNPPAPLEPCPCSHLLRPFWLMRCLYQTMAHPRGGYLSTKLFVPREVWKVKGVKLKAVEEKIANCDLLTAALGKLARVDMIDADTVLEEMQGLEVVLDQVQASLSKKLGNDVGVGGVGQLFKDAPVGQGEAGFGSGGGAAADASGERKSGSDKSKSYLASWRRLRSKNSAVSLPALNTGAGLGKKDSGAAGLGGAVGGGGGGVSEEGRNAPTMATVPMTSLPNIRFAKREVEKADFGGVGGGGGVAGSLGAYMGSLARLCDAVQVVDLIARQVEDPGLKLSSPTHVGLELCTRHASEFFGFYICRFVLVDVGVMLDKFLKRSSEWVLV